MLRCNCLLTAIACLSLPCLAAEDQPDKRAAQKQLQPLDVFGLEFASDPRISPDGKSVVYVRSFMDVMKDAPRSSLWTVGFDGSRHRPSTDGNHRESQPRWSPSGDRLAFVSNSDGTTQLYVRWGDTGQLARLTQLTRSPSALTWSPDGKWIAFSMLVPDKPEPLAKLPPKPKGAEWADPPKVIETLRYRFDGAGYLEPGFDHLFVVSASGGTPRQLTFGRFNHGGPLAWTPDSQRLLFSANRNEDWERDPVESDIYQLSLADGEVTKLTDRDGPDEQPTLSPNGDWIAYVGYDDKLLGYQNSELYVMRKDGSEARSLTADFDRSLQSPSFAPDGRGIYYLFDDEGTTHVGYVTLDGQRQTVAEDVGGVTLGRPYSSGSYTVAAGGRVALTHTSTSRPSDVATVIRAAGKPRRITELNEDLLGHKTLGEVEEVWFPSSHDQRRVQAWIVKPPEFSADKEYPLILEIHGGPFANYGDRFSAEMQLYAAAGYVVLYVNPRGSTSYGHEFANLIHHNYPGQDYDDLMSAVDVVLERGYVDKDRLYVTGGSGGGVLSSWIVGKTDRFRAAVVAKPVINWYSFALTTDAYSFFHRYWFSGYPWDKTEEYMRRSPISLVGNVSTPTMLLTGESDYRTPMSETEQFYQALQLREVDTALVRIPDASHSITARPSRLIAKVAYVLAWFEKYE